MAYSYKGSISFGLVYIPVKLEKCVKPNEVAFNLIDKKTMSRISYIKSCRECDGKEVKKEDIVKGYQYEDGKYVIFEDEDFEKIKSKRDKSIVIEQFADIQEIDPVYYDTAYYVVPTGAEKAYALLLEVLGKYGKAGIAKTVLGTRDTLVALRVRDGQMVLSTLFFHNEIKSSPEKASHEKITEKEAALAKMLVENMTKKFNPQDFKDEYSEKIMAAIETKLSGKKIVAARGKVESVADLMQALKQSVEASGKQRNLSAGG